MNKASGFTLIEMMIVVALVAILAAIAIPSYQSYITRSVCENAKSVLIGAGSAMERYRAQNNTYVGVNLANLGYGQSPVDGKAQFNIVANPVTASTYTLTATPVKPGGRLADKGTLTLNQSGARGATGTLSTANVWSNGCQGL